MVNCERVRLVFEQDDSSPCGLLMSYGPDMPDYFRKAAGYADKIPNGAKHADASLAAGPSRAGDQSQGGEGDGADHSAVSAGHHGRGHRMKPPMSPLMDISMRSADVRFRGANSTGPGNTF